MHHLTKAEELLPILRVARSHDERHWLMFLVAYWHGLRASEVTSGWSKIKGQKVFHEGLKTSNIIIGQKESYLIVQRLKGSLKTAQPLITHPEPLLNERAALEKLCRELKDGERLFPWTRQWFWKLFKQYGEEAGVPEFKAHPHVMKHSFAMHMRKVVDIATLRQLLGHSDISSTGEYLKISDDSATNELAAAIGAGSV